MPSVLFTVHTNLMTVISFHFLLEVEGGFFQILKSGQEMELSSCFMFVTDVSNVLIVK